jgi:hypothetical protein
METYRLSLERVNGEAQTLFSSVMPSDVTWDMIAGELWACLTAMGFILSKADLRENAEEGLDGY